MSRRFPNRSEAIQEAIQEKISRADKTRLELECAKLDTALEQTLADTGLPFEVNEWPEY